MCLNNVTWQNLDFRIGLHVCLINYGPINTAFASLISLLSDHSFSLIQIPLNYYFYIKNHHQLELVPTTDGENWPFLLYIIITHFLEQTLLKTFHNIFVYIILFPLI